MKTKVVTFTSAPNNYGHQQLTRSLEFWQVDYHVINEPWRGFGTKIIETAKYVETIKGEYTHFVFVDGHDTFFVLPPKDFGFKRTDKIEQAAIEMGWMDSGLVSTEKACWPDPRLAGQYPIEETNSNWVFLNSGCYVFNIQFYLDMVARNPIDYQDDDQLYLTKIYLSEKSFDLDRECQLFQSIAFLDNNEFSVIRLNGNGRGGRNVLHNKITNSLPMVVHNNGGNAKNPMEWIYNLIQ